MQLAYIQRSYNSVSLIFSKCIRTLLSILTVNRCSITEQIITQSHTHEHHDIRWKPNVGENHLLQFVSFFFNEKLLLQCTGAVLYQYAGYNLQRATTLLLRDKVP
jgi:hypothetical protein